MRVGFVIAAVAVGLGGLAFLVFQDPDADTTAASRPAEDPTDVASREVILAPAVRAEHPSEVERVAPDANHTRPPGPIEPLEAWRTGDWATTIRALREAAVNHPNHNHRMRYRARLLVAVLAQPDPVAGVEEMERWVVEICEQEPVPAQPHTRFSIWTDTGMVAFFPIQGLSHAYRDFGLEPSLSGLVGFRRWLGGRLDLYVEASKDDASFVERMTTLREFLAISDGHLPGSGASTEIRIAKVLPNVRAFLAKHAGSTGRTAAFCTWLRARYGQYL